jgi:hypothetical protein
MTVFASGRSAGPPAFARAPGYTCRPLLMVHGPTDHFTHRIIPGEVGLCAVLCQRVDGVGKCSAAGSQERSRNDRISCSLRSLDTCDKYPTNT